MKDIQVALIDTGQLHRSMIILSAKISMDGSNIRNGNDLVPLLKETNDEYIKKMVALPHTTLQKHSSFSLVFIGVSRRFLAQITRHQNEIKFMSSSFRHEDHSAADFVIPLEVTRQGDVKAYKAAMEASLMNYKTSVAKIGKDAAGYLLPNATRVTLLATASLYEWKHIIKQRTCKRCGLEMRYVMLHAWKLLYDVDPILFSPQTTGPMCLQQRCNEGSQCCGSPISPTDGVTPDKLLSIEFGDIVGNMNELENINDSEIQF